MAELNQSLTTKTIENHLSKSLYSFKFKNLKQISYKIFEEFLSLLSDEYKKDIKYSVDKNDMTLFYKGLLLANVIISRKTIIPGKEYQIKKIDFNIYNNGIDDVYNRINEIETHKKNETKKEWAIFYKTAKELKEILKNNNQSLEQFNKFVDNYLNIRSNDYLNKKLEETLKEDKEE